MDKLKIGLAQFAPVRMNRQKTLEKALKYAEDTANEDCELIVLEKTRFMTGKRNRAVFLHFPMNEVFVFG